MRVSRSVGSLLAVGVFLATMNLGCASRQPAGPNPWEVAAQQANASASRADTAASRAEAAASRAEAAAQRVEAATRRIEDVSSRIESGTMRRMLK
ncbi:MAG: hypothetical protein AB7G75_20545 [Candidatus Binatia bacterium]